METGTVLKTTDEKSVVDFCVEILGVCGDFIRMKLMRKEKDSFETIETTGRICGKEIEFVYWGEGDRESVVVKGLITEEGMELNVPGIGKTVLRRDSKTIKVEMVFPQEEFSAIGSVSFDGSSRKALFTKNGNDLLVTVVP